MVLLFNRKFSDFSYPNGYTRVVTATKVTEKKQTAKLLPLFRPAQHIIDGGLQILQRVDRQAFSHRDGRPNTIAVLQPTQLLERLASLENALRQGGNLPEHVAAVGIQPDMLIVGMRTLPLRRLDSAKEGNRRTAEIERMTVGRQDHLRRVGIENILVRSERLDQRGDLGRRLVETPGDPKGSSP